MDPARRTLCPGDWAASARLLVAKFRADSASHIGDPAFEELTSALNSSSLSFASCGNATRSPAAAWDARS